VRLLSGDCASAFFDSAPHVAPHVPSMSVSYPLKNSFRFILRNPSGWVWVVASKGNEARDSQNKMKTKKFHESNMGRFSPGGADSSGYITVHDSPRYASATDDQLAEWSESRIAVICSAARTEQAERSLRQWRAAK